MAYTINLENVIRMMENLQKTDINMKASIAHVATQVQAPLPPPHLPQAFNPLALLEQDPLNQPPPMSNQLVNP